MPEDTQKDPQPVVNPDHVDDVDEIEDDEIELDEESMQEAENETP